MVSDGSNTGIVGSNPARGMDVRQRFPLLCCPVSEVALGWADHQPKCLKLFIVSEVNSNSNLIRKMDKKIYSVALDRAMFMGYGQTPAAR
jgi:hypothetical protein